MSEELSNADIAARLTGGESHKAPKKSHKKSVPKKIAEKPVKLMRDSNVPKSPEIPEAEGGDLVQNVKDFIKGRPNGVFPPKVRKFIASRGIFMIMGVSVVRQPISEAIMKAINVLSLGKVAQSMKQLNIDKLRHLYVVLDIMDPRTNRLTSWLLEKNETIRVVENSGNLPQGAETIDLGAPKTHMTVAELFATLHREDSSITIYDSVSANCQDFATHVLKILGIWNPDVGQFVKQNLTQLISPFFQKVGKAITDTKSRLDILAEGAGANPSAKPMGNPKDAHISRLEYSNAAYVEAMRARTRERSLYAY